MKTLLPEIAAEELVLRRGAPVDSEALATASAIVSAVRTQGEKALLEYTTRFGEAASRSELYIERDRLKGACNELPGTERELLMRTAERISAFAHAQRDTISELNTKIIGGRAGHRVLPLQRAACYAPGGRYPLPSSMLMTLCAARAAGVPEVIAASPRPTVHTLAAAYIGGAEMLLAAGGAQAIAALAYGAGPVKAADIIVGPGSRWVTAAKQLVSADVAIDMLAGPSELVVIADSHSDPALIAADLIAQGEHDDAFPVLISLDRELVELVRLELTRQLETLSTAALARAALERGAVCIASSIDDCISLSNALAPEHLELLVSDPERWIPHLTGFGALFIGSRSAEVAGDYGAGPNHVLPTGGTARLKGGLSVFTFLRIATWLQLDTSPESDQILNDSAALARLEGLEGHARSAEKRL